MYSVQFLDTFPHFITASLRYRLRLYLLVITILLFLFGVSDNTSHSDRISHLLTRVLNMEIPQKSLIIPLSSVRVAERSLTLIRSSVNSYVSVLPGSPDFKNVVATAVE